MYKVFKKGTRGVKKIKFKDQETRTIFGNNPIDSKLTRTKNNSKLDQLTQEQYFHQESSRF